MTTAAPSPIRIVDPTGEDLGLSDVNLAPRPADLRGKRLGLLDNSKVNAEVILRAIARILLVFSMRSTNSPTSSTSKSIRLLCRPIRR